MPVVLVKTNESYSRGSCGTAKDRSLRSTDGLLDGAGGAWVKERPELRWLSFESE